VEDRGVRVEPREVERALEHPAVAAAAMVAHRDAADDVSLAAFVVFAGTPVASGELRAFLAARLPAAGADPVLCAELDALPLNASGKVDRHRLAQLPLETSAPAEGAAPRDRRTVRSHLAAD
jgi:enterobactin synthetase component F